MDIQYLSAKDAAAAKQVSIAAIYLAWNTGLLRYTLIAGKRVTTQEWLDEYTPLRNDERKGAKLKTRKEPKRKKKSVHSEKESSDFVKSA